MGGRDEMRREEVHCHPVVQRNAATYRFIDKALVAACALICAGLCLNSFITTQTERRELLPAPGYWHGGSGAENREHMVPDTHSDLDCGLSGVCTCSRKKIFKHTYTKH